MFKAETFALALLGWLMGWGMTVKLGVLESHEPVFFLIAGGFALVFAIVLKIVWTLLCMGTSFDEERTDK